MPHKPKTKPRPDAPGTPVMVRLQPGQLEWLDDWRRRQRDLPSRAEAIRRLLEQTQTRRSRS